MAKILKGNEFKNKLNLKQRLDSDISSTLGAGGRMGRIIGRGVLEAGGVAESILDEAKDDASHIREEAREILDKVQEEMEAKKKEGYEKGYQEGLQQGMEMLHRVKELRQKLFTDNEKEMVKLTFEIAKKIIGREIAENDKAIMNIIRLAISDAVGDKITVKVNPKDYANIKKNEKEFLKSIETGKTINFREDEEIQFGGCVVDTEIGTIDAQLDTQLNAIKKALGL